MFSTLSKMGVPDKGATAAMTLHEIGPMKEGADTPVLILKFIGPSNKPLANAAAKLESRFRRGKRRSAEQDAQYAAGFREVFAKHGIAGWDHVYDEGEAVPFSRENALEFFSELPEHAMVAVVDFAGDAANFEQDDEAADPGN